MLWEPGGGWALRFRRARNARERKGIIYGYQLLSHFSHSMLPCLSLRVPYIQCHRLCGFCWSGDRAVTRLFAVFCDPTAVHRIRAQAQASTPNQLHILKTKPVEMGHHPLVAEPDTEPCERLCNSGPMNALHSYIHICTPFSCSVAMALSVRPTSAITIHLKRCFAFFPSSSSTRAVHEHNLRSRPHYGNHQGGYMPCITHLKKRTRRP